MVEEITRRAILSIIPVGLASAYQKSQKTQLLPQAGEFVRFADPTTETAVVRLTSPAYSNVLPTSTNRFVSLKPRALFCSSDRMNGQLAPFQIDLRTGTIRQLADTHALDPASLALDTQGRFLYFLDGGVLSEVAVGKRETKRAEALATDISAFSPGVSRAEFFLVRQRRLERMNGVNRETLAENASGPCIVRPNGDGCLFTRISDSGEHEIWYAGTAAAPKKPVLIARGRVSNPYWSVNGHSVLFLRDVPVNDVFVTEARELAPEEGVERCVSRTSQFAAFSPNGDDSVFVGASRSKAQPNVILLLRNPSRELTLCEHRSSHPADVKPVFSPDSRRVYFQSDREGKPAIYSVNVEHLVEPT